MSKFDDMRELETLVKLDKYKDVMKKLKFQSDTIDMINFVAEQESYKSNPNANFMKRIFKMSNYSKSELFACNIIKNSGNIGIVLDILSHCNCTKSIHQYIILSVAANRDELTKHLFIKATENNICVNNFVLTDGVIPSSVVMTDIIKNDMIMTFKYIADIHDYPYMKELFRVASALCAVKICIYITQSTTIDINSECLHAKVLEKYKPESDIYQILTQSLGLQ